MQAYEIQNFVDGVKKTSALLSELAATESLGYEGINRAEFLSMHTPIMEFIDDFDRHLIGLLRIAKYSDADIHQQFIDITEHSNTASGIAEISAAIKIAKIRSSRERSISSKIMCHIFSIDYDSIATIKIGDIGITIQKVLVGLNRIASLASELHDAYYIKQVNDESHFKPSNVNIKLITRYIDDAAISISTNENILEHERIYIINHIESIKAELNADIPNWKKIIGALVIVSTIISGIASVPLALDSINNAIDNILGSAINKNHHYIDPTPSNAGQFLIT